jgi:hypothetical protein
MIITKCKYCGKDIVQSTRRFSYSHGIKFPRQTKIYCSDRCRRAQHKKELELLRKKMEDI